MPVGNTKYNCGSGIPSSCVPYTGSTLTFFSSPDELSCDANLDDVIILINKYLKKLVDGNNLTTLNKNKLSFDPSTITPVELHQLEIDAISNLMGQYDALSTQLNSLDIGKEIITITLPSCLATAASSCAVVPNEYQLISLLTLFANKLCDHETRITNLEA